MDDEAMRWGDGNIAPSHRLIASPHRPSHRLIVHRIASSSIASPHRPSHRLIVHRIASSSIASPHRLPLRNASWTTGCSSCACLTHCGLGSWTHRPTVLSAPVSVDASPHRTYSPIKIRFTAPSRIRPIGLTAPPRIRHIFAAFFKPT